MKKVFLLIASLLLLTPLCCFAGFGYGKVIVGDGVAASASTGTWYYVADTCTTGSQELGSSDFALMSAVTISGTAISKLAFKVKEKGSATSAKIVLYPHALDIQDPLVSGTCTPADESWCVAPVTYTASASTYYVAYMTDADLTLQYGNASGTDGGYGGARTYASFDTEANVLVSYDWSWAVAICVGTCSTGP